MSGNSTVIFLAVLSLGTHVFFAYNDPKHLPWYGIWIAINLGILVAELRIAYEAGAAQWAAEESPPDNG